jgi:regulator of replication initiation timing
MMPDGAGPCIGYEQAYAAISALEKERDEAISQRNDWKRDFDYVYDERKSLRAEVERLGINELDCKTLRAENKRLREALEAVCVWDQTQDEPFTDVLARASAALQSTDLQSKLDKIEKDDPERHQRILDRSAALQSKGE